MNKKEEIQKIYYQFLNDKLKPKLHYHYSSKVYVGSKGFYYSTFKEYQELFKHNNKWFLPNFIQKCFKKDNYSAILLRDKSEVEDFIKYLERFVTDKRYAEEFNILLKEYSDYSQCLNEPHPRQKLFSHCRSLSMNLSDFYPNKVVPTIRNRAEVGNNEITSDHNLISIATMPGILVLLASVSMLLYCILNKLKSYINRDQEPPISELEEGSAHSKDSAVRHRVPRF